MIEGIDSQVKAAIDVALKQMRSLGAEIIDVSLPHTDYAVAVYYILATAEASANLARFDGVRYGYRAENPGDILELYGRTREEGFGSEVKRRVILGTYVLSSGYYDAYYLRAQKVRELIRQDFAKVFEKVDALISPTSPVPAFKLSERTANPLILPISSPSRRTWRNMRNCHAVSPKRTDIACRSVAVGKPRMKPRNRACLRAEHRLAQGTSTDRARRT
jgi:aspartyl-tRNA(Asn)/glutamyl-tRNA(Gln) amidotransferase subunit A